MNTILKLCGACIACAMLVAGTISANADIGRDDEASKAVSIGTQVALNAQRLPPRCFGCRHVGGGAKGTGTRSSRHNVLTRPFGGPILTPAH